MHVLHADVDGVNSTPVKSSPEEFGTVSVLYHIIHLFENICTHFKQAWIKKKVKNVLKFCRDRKNKQVCK